MVLCMVVARCTKSLRCLGSLVAGNLAETGHLQNVLFRIKVLNLKHLTVGQFCSRFRMGKGPAFVFRCG